jgi:sugar phosphate isomerase/epimerase
MKTAIVGWTGFVGQNLLSQLPSDTELYNSKNIDTLKYKDYDILYFSAMPAEKWKINKDPLNDYNNLIYLENILKTVQIKTFILISTIDVLDCRLEQDEYGINFAEHPYGKHRRMLEEFILKNFINSYIIRLPGIFGWGLKKNIIYDLLHNNQLKNICISSKFQWYFLDNLIEDINHCISKGYNCVQFVSEPIDVDTIVKLFFPEKYNQCIGTDSVSYNLKTKYSSINYWTSSKDILSQLNIFIQREHILINLPYRLSVSNIAWDHNNVCDIIKLCNSFHISSIELAPTKIYKWNEWTLENINTLKECNIKFSSCQSILYNTNIKIFENTIDFLKHYEKVCNICNELNIKYIVFGSPTSRHLVDGIDTISLFKQIGYISEKYDIICCIEPNSKLYGCTWLTNLNEVLEFIKNVDHKNIMINFDLGNYIMENDTSDINNVLSYIAHIQISLPYLNSFHLIDDNTRLIYNKIIKILNDVSYSNNISLEMKCTNINYICKSLINFNKLYYN